MSFSNLGYNGNTPSNVSVQDNINQALQYQSTHNEWDTLMWFKDMVQNKGAWDYKQLSSDYENFGNFNYGAVGAALGYPDFVLQSAAGGAQFASLFGGKIYGWAALDWVASWHPFVNSGSYDDPKDQAWINKGIDAAQIYGFDPYMQALESIDNAINALFNSAQGWMPPRSGDPLVLDLDSDGIETLQINTNSPVLFDHDGDGVKIATGWVKSDDALLVLDRNSNGTIDNGSELFGDQTIVNGVKATDGFAALSAEDSNANGIFDTNDTNFNNVRLWQDLNQNGISETNELKTLTQAGIVSISLSSTQTNTVVNGGIQTAKGTFTKSDGTIGESATVDVGSLGNYIFNTNSFYREFSDTIALTEVASTLPQMQGSGLVRDLREAASMQTTEGAALTDILTQYSSLTTHDEQIAFMYELLLAWGATSSLKDMSTEATQHGYTLTTNLNAEQFSMLNVLEQFNGRHFYRMPWESTENTTARLGMSVDETTKTISINMVEGQLSILEQAYETLVGSVYDGLALQTRLTPQLQNYTKPLNNINLSQYITKLEMRTDIIKNNFFICLNNLNYPNKKYS